MKVVQAVHEQLREKIEQHRESKAPEPLEVTVQDVGGILRSGGKTKYVLFDLIGTWIFRVPLGLLSAFVWKLSIPYVYFILSLEECIRFGITLVIFKTRKWMNVLDAAS